MDPTPPEIFLTQDGSPSLFSARFGEPYHSRNGAIQESLHVFMRMGWEVILSEKKEIHVLEMGLGTGLNALLTVEAQAALSNLAVKYTALEAYPIGAATWQKLAYPALLGGGAIDWFTRIHEAPWEKETEIRPDFWLRKQQITLEDYSPASTQFDLVYFDAFAPESQPELWTESVFIKLWEATQPGGVLVTYCAKGAVRRAMQAAGWVVERLPGPPGKREMLRAKK